MTITDDLAVVRAVLAIGPEGSTLPPHEPEYRLASQGETE